MKKTWLILSFLSFCLIGPRPAFCLGHEGGNGGDEVALEFTNAFSAALVEIHTHQPDLARQLPLDPDFASIPEQTHIFVQDDPLFVPAEGGKEQESVAVNEPGAKSIWINRSRWQKIQASRVREAIALHEFLSLVGLEATGRYPISAAYLARFHLRNDGLMLVSGQDPELPAWKTQRITCEQQYVWRDPKAKRDTIKIDSSLRAELSWKVGDTYFDLRYNFGHDNGKDLVVTSLVQTTAKNLGLRDGLTLMELESSRSLGKVGKLAGESKSGPKASYVAIEDLGGGKSMSWSWINGRKFQPLLSSTKTDLADGSVRNQTVDLTPAKTFGIRSMAEDCVTKDIPNDDWEALTSDPQMGIEIEKLNGLAMLYYDADRKLQVAGDVGERSVAEQTRDASLNQFKAGWNRLFENRAGLLGINLRGQ